jgi:hypothetical protein
MWHLPVHLVHLTLAVVAAANVDAGSVSASADQPLPIRLQLVRPPPAPARDPNDPPMDYELHRVKGGSGDLTYDAPGFTARIAHDGSVTFRDKHFSASFALLPNLRRQPTITGVPTLESVLRGNAKKPDPTPVSPAEQAALYGSRLPIPTVTPYRPDPREACQYPAPCFFYAPVLLLSIKTTFDLTDELMRLGGQDPHRYAKARFLAGTREMRTRMAARAHADDVRKSATGLPEHLEAIACDGRLSVGERRAIIEALGAELDTSTAEGRAAEAEIGSFLARFGQADGSVTCSSR